MKNTPITHLITLIIVLLISTSVGIYERHHWNLLIKKCEIGLPIHQKCVLIAVPEKMKRICPLCNARIKDNESRVVFKIKRSYQTVHRSCRNRELKVVTRNYDKDKL